MATMVLKWRTSEDDRVCPYCNALDGHEWVLDTGKDAWPDILHHEGHAVWNTLGDYSMAHVTFGINFDCRCSVKVADVDASDIERAVNLLYRAALAAAGAQATGQRTLQ